MTRRRLLAIAAAALWLAGCAPRLAVPPETSFGDREARYRTLLSERQARAVAVDASLVVWVERAGERLPGAQAELRLAAPDRMRLRVASAFGTAIDFGLAGDSLRAYVPGWRTGLRLDAASESLRFEAPADRVVRALSATWQPPAGCYTMPSLVAQVVIKDFAVRAEDQAGHCYQPRTRLATAAGDSASASASYSGGCAP